MSCEEKQKRLSSQDFWLTALVGLEHHQFIVLVPDERKISSVALAG
jgi:hypothetical protein